MTSSPSTTPRAADPTDVGPGERSPERRLGRAFVMGPLPGRMMPGPAGPVSSRTACCPPRCCLSRRSGRIHFFDDVHLPGGEERFRPDTEIVRGSSLADTTYV